MEKGEEEIDYTLEDVFLEHQKNPRHFTIPSKEEIRNLKVGDKVRLFFILSNNNVKDSPRAERMWVEIKSIDGDKFTGELLNYPYFITTIKAGDNIEFFNRNIATVIVPRPKFDLNKTGIISKRILETREINELRRVSTEELIDENDSGWEFYYGDEDENVEIYRITLDEVLDMEPLLEKVFNENGKAYVYNKEKNVFEEVEDFE